MEAESKLLQNINICRNNLGLLIQEKNILALKMREIQSGFSVFSSGISPTKSILKVSVIEAKGLDPISWNKVNNTYVHLTYNGYYSQTKVIDSVNPKWNESFEL